jgi:tetratricopeptide (TPR) repeat protein
MNEVLRPETAVGGGRHTVTGEPPADGARPGPHTPLAPAVCVALLTALPFLPVLNNQLTNWDDRDLITDNVLIRDLSARGVVRIFTSMHAHLYNPLVVLSHAVEYRFFGHNPRVYHGTNLLLHSVCAALLVLLLLRWGFPPVAAAVGGLLWAVHPLRVESVAWASERKDVLCGVFFLAGLIAHERASASSRRFSALPVFAWFTAALLSKPAAVTFPAVLWVVDGFRGRPWTSRTWLRMTPFFAGSAVIAVITFSAQRAIDNIPFSGAFPVHAAVYNAVYALSLYAVKTLLPAGLSVHYPRPDTFAAALGSILPGAGIAAGAAWVWFRSDAGMRRVLAFGGAFFLIAMAPMIQAVPVGHAAAADRYTYLPALGLAAVAAEIARRTFPRNAVLAPALTALLIVGLGTLTWRRCFTWKDSITIWNDAVERYPNSALALVCRGRTFSELGDHRRALEDLNRAIALSPDYTMARMARGIVLDRIGRHREAVADFTAVITRRPSYAGAWYNRGIAHQNLGTGHAAEADYTKALELNPTLAQAAVNRGNIRLQTGDRAGALRDYTHALQANPDLAEAYNNRAFVRFLGGDVDGALQDIRRARALGWKVNPGFVSEVERRLRSKSATP